MKFSVHCHIRTKTLSVKALEGPFKGLIVASAEKIQLDDAEFRVSEAGRQRVLRTKRKNVHAGCVGTPTAIWGATVRDDLDEGTFAGLGIGKNWPVFGGLRVRYNPYLTKTFVKSASGEPVVSAKRVQLDRCSIRAAGIK